MQLSRTQFQILVASIFFLGVCCLLLPLSTKIVEEEQESQFSPIDLDTTFLFQKRVITNRLPKFIHYLNRHCIPVRNDYELLLLLSNPFVRQRISHQLQVDSNLLLLHAELADLMQIGMTDLDAQILLFSQRNYQNPFTGETMNLQILAEADAERLIQDMGGWMAGNGSALLQNYSLSIEDIESWIDQAKAHPFKIFAQIP